MVTKKLLTIGEGTCCDNAEKLRKAEQRIKELEQDIESYKQAFIEMEGNADMARKLQPKHNLEQGAKAIEDGIRLTMMSYTHKYSVGLLNYAKQLRKKAEDL